MVKKKEMVFKERRNRVVPERVAVVDPYRVVGEAGVALSVTAEQHEDGGHREDEQEGAHGE
jgi:hypothetical protein